MFIRLSTNPIKDTQEIQPGLMLDYDDNGTIVAIEILDRPEIVITVCPKTE